jgi:putative DNA-invertase from lambdoid prophage Rac
MVTLPYNGSSKHHRLIDGQPVDRPQGYGPGVIQNSLERPSARVGFPSVDYARNGQDLWGQEAPMKTVLYCRVSTVDQTLEHQRTQAEAAGYRFDEVVVDHGISGVRTALRERPEGKRLFDMLRDGDTLVVRWLDRLGRNYGDVTDTIREFIRRGVIVRTVINALVFDGATKDPMAQAVRDSLIAFMAAMAQSQAEATKEAQKAGIAHVLKHDDGTKYRGRKPTFSPEQFRLVRDLLNQGITVSAIAKSAGVKRQSVYRIQAEPERQLAALEAWYPTEAA